MPVDLHLFATGATIFPSCLGLRSIVPCRWIGFLCLLAFVVSPEHGFSQGWERSNFVETVSFIDGKLSQVESNKRVGYRLKPSTICLAHFGNDSIRTELNFSTLGEVETSGNSAILVCGAERHAGQLRPSTCISAQHHAQSAWAIFDRAEHAQFSLGSETDAEQVRQALSHLISMCGGGR